MTLNELFKIVPARAFFKTYCPGVTMFYHKKLGYDGNGNPVSFTHEEKKQIKQGLKKMRDDLKKVKL